MLLGSLLAVIYIWRLVEVAYFWKGEDEVCREAPLSLLIPTAILALANIYFGIDTRLPVYLSDSAAQMLFGVSP